jgi:tRNA A-37 threonylcarbamoyl transferase component Bud32
MSAPAPARPADRNLLFGILALQMDFLSRDVLIAAMHAWVLDKAKPLGQILLEQGALRPDTHALLEALVGKHLEMHGGDPERSLASVSSLGSVRRDLEQVADSELHASLAHVSAARAPDADPYATRDVSAGTPTSSGLRFRILRPHAKGGLGEVFVAHDEELHRKVALKEIQNQHADNPESRSRFVLEAEITGGLEHPGIVPVYGLGTYADGRPFYAMRFIRGDSLKDAIDRFHKADVPSRDPGERALALRPLLRRFVDVCNAVAYAHARGVLHRDLKPGNVILGQYGETLVVDWGLAKPLGCPEGMSGLAEGPLQPASASGSAPTQMGVALGTPQYMSPEQAAGRLDEMGPASDSSFQPWRTPARPRSPRIQRATQSRGRCGITGLQPRRRASSRCASRNLGGSPAPLWKRIGPAACRGRPAEPPLPTRGLNRPAGPVRRFRIVRDGQGRTKRRGHHPADGGHVRFVLCDGRGGPRLPAPGGGCSLRRQRVLDAPFRSHWRRASDDRILAGSPRGRPAGHCRDRTGGTMIANDQELQTTLDRIAWFQEQVAHLRQTETNPVNYRASVSGFLAEIDRMQLDVREYFSFLPAERGGAA